LNLAFDVQPNGTLKNRRNFAKYESTDPLTEGPFKLTSGADGLAAGSEGRIYIARLNGIEESICLEQLFLTIPTE
jgi:hypothetical protein